MARLDKAHSVMPQIEDEFLKMDMYNAALVRQLFRSAIIPLGVHVVAFWELGALSRYHVVIEYRERLFELDINPASKPFQCRRFEVQNLFNNWVAQIVDWQAEC
jgi:hypothetical protein